MIVNADDYGLTAGVSRGIRETHLRGIVSSTSVMVNMQGVEKELEAVMEETPRLGLGVHLNLTAGRPLIMGEEIPVLVDETGSLFQRKSFVEHADLIPLEQVEREWEGQVRYFIQMTGRKPTHLDSHHHCSFYTPSLFTTMLMLAEKYQCAIRNIFSEFPFALGEDFTESQQEETRGGSQSISGSYHLAQPDHFHSSFFGTSATLEKMRSIISDLADGVTEVMCHPGYADESLVKGSSYAWEREGELKILTDAEVIRLVKEKLIELITFDGIQANRTQSIGLT